MLIFQRLHPPSRIQVRIKAVQTADRVPFVVEQLTLAGSFWQQVALKHSILRMKRALKILIKSCLRAISTA